MNLKILYLGPKTKLYSFLKSFGSVKQTEDKLSFFELKKYDWVISYGYRHILSQQHIDNCKNPIINLHISYLPYNRGADPNFWSWLENSPKGVTIHKIDSGIDTGDIFIQKEVIFKDNETLASSYNILKQEIENLFINNFENIIKGVILPQKQFGKGSFHQKKDFELFKNLLTKGWDTPVNTIKMTDLEIINEIEKVRNKNNVNWMDILRLAFKYSPKEARVIIAKINKDDNRISELLEQLSSND